MTDETKQYLLNLQEKINDTEEIFLEPNEDYNRGYLEGKQLTINDVISSIKFYEGKDW